MKKKFITVVAFVMVGITSSIANEPNIDPRILSAFEKEFSFAKNVEWETRGPFIQVNFSLNGQGVVAWYNSEAELISTARNILYNQLPLSVIKALENDYADASLYAMVEINRDGETYYHIHAEKKNKKVLLKATQSGNIMVIKKFK